MLVSMCGHFVSHNVGDHVDFADDVAQRLIDREFAEAVEVAAKTTKPKIETADRPKRGETRSLD